MSSVNLIVGSQMGSAEYVAEQLSDALNSQGINTQLFVHQPMVRVITQKTLLTLLMSYLKLMIYRT